MEGQPFDFAVVKWETMQGEQWSSGQEVKSGQVAKSERERERERERETMQWSSGQ